MDFNSLVNNEFPRFSMEENPFLYNISINDLKKTQKTMCGLILDYKYKSLIPWKLIDKFNVTKRKISSGLFLELSATILKFIWNNKSKQVADSSLKTEELRVDICSLR